MIEVIENLFVGDQGDWRRLREKDWMVVQAARDPFHRDAVGYTGRSAPASHPEYLMAKRDNRLILNLVDADDKKYFSVPPIEAALLFIAGNVQMKRRTLVHCNQGQSRAPLLAMLYMHKFTPVLSYNFAHAESEFCTRYPRYKPGLGFRQFVKDKWEYFAAD